MLQCGFIVEPVKKKHICTANLQNWHKLFGYLNKMVSVDRQYNEAFVELKQIDKDITNDNGII